MKTALLNKKDIKRKYYLVDAKGKILGRLAVGIALLLSGKRKIDYTPHVDNGDFVIVVNAGQVALTGRKLEQKIYTSYSGYPGGLKVKNLERMLKVKPTQVLKNAVKGMLPRNKLRSKMINRLKLYAGPEHPHIAQQPEKIELGEE